MGAVPSIEVLIITSIPRNGQPRKDMSVPSKKLHFVKTD